GLGLGTAVGAVAPDAGPLGRGLFGLLLTYLGASVALAKRDELEDMSTKLFPKTAARRQGFKILDTSVIIDGRIVDLSEVGFLEGTLIIPQFVLRELQQIADSPDPLKRNRGKRGFDVLQRLQRLPGATVRIEDQDFPQVDRKSTRLNSSHVAISYAVFCLKKKKDISKNYSAEREGIGDRLSENLYTG